MNHRVWLLLLLNFTTLFALTAPLDLNTSHTYIGKSMHVYEDKSAQLDFNQVSQLPLESFSSIENSIFTCPFSKSAFWYTFTLNNSQKQDLSRLFVFEAPWLDYIQINILSPNGHTQQYELGNTFDYDQRSIDHHFINQRHLFEPGLSTVYIQVKTRDPFVFATSILDEHQFLLNQIQNSKYTGIIFGILIAMLLYNFLIFIGIKEPYFAYYVLFVIAFLLMNSSYNGYLFQKFQFTSLDIQNWINSSSIFLFLFTYLLFTKSFLSLKKEHEQLNTTTNYVIYILLITAFLSALTGGYRLHVILSIIFVVIISFYIFSIAVYSWKKGNRSARFFILGSIGGIFGSVITALTVMGQIPYNPVAYKALDYGMLVDAILLSLALSDRIKITQEEKNVAEIEKTIAEAEKILAEKSARTDFLTGLMNRRAYDEITGTESNRSSRYHMNMSLVLLDIDDFKSFNDNYGHHVGDMALKHFAEILIHIKRECDYAFRLGGDEFVILLPQTPKSDAISLAQRIQEEVRSKKLRVNHDTLHMSVSYGAAEYQPNDRSIEQILKRADIALYQAKENERTQTSS